MFCSYQLQIRSHGFTVHSSTTNELEEQIDRTYIGTNALENTSEFSLQENELELYKFSLEYEPSEILQLEYNILLNKSDQYENNDLTSMYGRQDNRMQETLDITRSQKPQSLNQEFKLYFTLADDHIFSFEAQHLDQEENPFSRAIRDRNPFTRLIPFSSSVNKYDVTQERLVHTAKLEAKLDYYYLLNDTSNINLSLGVTDVGQDFDSSFFQILDNGTLLNFNDPTFNNDVSFDFSDAYIALNYRLRTGIFTIDPGLTLHYYKTKNTQLGTSFERNISDVRPNLRINLQFKKSESLRLTYRKNTQFTDINNLAEGFVFSNYNSIFQGNRELEAAVVNNYNLNYRSINQFTFTNIFANANYSKRSNSIQSRANINGIDAIRTSTNSNFPRETYSLSGRIDKRFKNFKLNFSTRFNYSDFTNEVNNQIRNSQSLNQNYSASIETNFRDKPNFEIGYFLYSNCDTMILGEIFYRAVGQDIKTFGDTHLFSKLNISADWWRDNSTGGQANGNFLSYCCIDMTTRDCAKVALLLMNDGVWQGEQIIPLSYVQAIKNITTSSVITETNGGVISYGLKFWSLYGGSNCGGTGVQVGTGDQKCVPDNTIITPIGFDGQYMLMDFTNNLIMIRFSLYLPAEQANSEKKMTVSDPANLAYIFTAPTAVTSTSDPANVPLSVFFPAAEYWYRLNN